MLTKPTLATVIPAVEGREYQEATHTCFSAPPAGSGGDSDPPSTPPPPTGVTPDPGTPIWLEPTGLPGYGSTAPAPSGYACRYETIYIYAPGQTEPAAVYYVVCTQS